MLMVAVARGAGSYSVRFPAYCNLSRPRAVGARPPWVAGVQITQEHVICRLAGDSTPAPADGSKPRPADQPTTLGYRHG